MDGDYLLSMKENKKIYHDDEDKIVSETADSKVILSGDESVSMNFFGFSTAIIDYFQNYFDQFLKESVTSATDEVLLPEAVSLMVKEGVGKMRFYTTDERWFGMTYQEDRQIVKDEIARMIERREYPAKLWKN